MPGFRSFCPYVRFTGFVGVKELGCGGGGGLKEFKLDLSLSK